MKQKILILITLLFALPLFGQEDQPPKGIKFFEGSFAEGIEQAKKESKLLFLDCYTTWCGPCKKMSAEIFPHPGVGALYNTYYVSMKIDMEKGEGPTLAKQYKIAAYPTMLFIDPNSLKAVHRIVGSRDIMGFIEETRKVMAGNTINSLDKRYENGERGNEFVESYIEALRMANMSDKMKEVITEYLNDKCDELLVNERYFQLARLGISSPYSDIFKYLISHKEEVIAKYGPAYYVGGHEYMVWLNYPLSFIYKDGDKFYLDSKKMNEYREYMYDNGVEQAKKIEKNAEMEVALRNGDWKNYINIEESCIEDSNVEVLDIEIVNWSKIINSKCSDKGQRERQALIAEARMNVLKKAKEAEPQKEEKPLPPGTIRAFNMNDYPAILEVIVRELRTK